MSVDATRLEAPDDDAVIETEALVLAKRAVREELERQARLDMERMAWVRRGADRSDSQRA